MDFYELLKALGISETKVIVHLVTPVRNGEDYKSGEMIGFKPGKWGGGHYNYEREPGGYKTRVPRSYSSLRNHWIKKPKICVAYNIWTFHGGNHFDWVDFDNCRFEIQEKPKMEEKPEPSY